MQNSCNAIAIESSSFKTACYILFLQDKIILTYKTLGKWNCFEKETIVVEEKTLTILTMHKHIVTVVLYSCLVIIFYGVYLKICCYNNNLWSITYAAHLALTVIFSIAQ